MKPKRKRFQYCPDFNASLFIENVSIKHVIFFPLQKLAVKRFDVDRLKSFRLYISDDEIHWKIHPYKGTILVRIKSICVSCSLVNSRFEPTIVSYQVDSYPVGQVVSIYTHTYQVWGILNKWILEQIRIDQRLGKEPTQAENESSEFGYESTENKITGYLLTKHPPIAKKN